MSTLSYEELLLLETPLLINKQQEKPMVNLDQINWERLLTLSKWHRMLPIVCKLFRSDMPSSYRVLYNKFYHAFCEKIDVMLIELEKIKELLSLNNIAFVLIKGFALSQMIYDDVYMRPSNDMDILVNEKDVNKVHSLMMRMGYNHPTRTRNRINESMQNINRNKKPHEFRYIKFVDDKKIVFEIKIASSAIKPEHIINFHSEVQNTRIGKIDINTNNITYSLLHLCSNVYANTAAGIIRNNNSVNLRDYIDIKVFLSKYHDSIDWNKISELANELEILHKVKYVFINLNSLYSDTVNGDILALFGLERASYRVDDDKAYNKVYKQRWFKNFKVLLFDEENRIEYARLTRMKVQGVHEEPKILGIYSDIKTRVISEYEDLQGKQLFDIKYNFYIDNKHLYFSCILGNTLYNMLEKYRIVIRISDKFEPEVNSNFNEFFKDKQHVITKKGDQTVASYNELQWKVTEIITQDDLTLIDVSIPIASICENKKFEKLYYYIVFREEFGDKTRVVSKTFSARRPCVLYATS